MFHCVVREQCETWSGVCAGRVACDLTGGEKRDSLRMAVRCVLWLLMMVWLVYSHGLSSHAHLTLAWESEVAMYEYLWQQVRMGLSTSMYNNELPKGLTVCDLWGKLLGMHLLHVYVSTWSSMEEVISWEVCRMCKRPTTSSDQQTHSYSDLATHRTSDILRWSLDAYVNLHTLVPNIVAYCIGAHTGPHIFTTWYMYITGEHKQLIGAYGLIQVWQLYQLSMSICI